MRSFQVASFIAVAAAGVAVTLKILEERIKLELMFFESDAMYTSFSFFCTMLLVFRTSQAYSRFSDGATCLYRMVGDLFDTATTVIAFTRFSHAGQEEIQTFRQTLVRLISLLSAMILAELEGSEPGQHVNALHFELVDVECIDPDSLLYLKKASQKPEVVFQWIQNLIVDNITTGVLSIPPPLLTRTFQDLGSAMIQYHDAMKYTEVPIPFPYIACSDILLLIHWVVTPIVISSWIPELVWAALFTFVMVFVVWSLHFIAGELENPFGCDVNDLHMEEIQRGVNSSLILLLENNSRQAPHLCVNTRTAASRLANKAQTKTMKSFDTVVEEALRSTACGTNPWTGRFPDVDAVPPSSPLSMSEVLDDLDGQRPEDNTRPGCSEHEWLAGDKLGSAEPPLARPRRDPHHTTMTEDPRMTGAPCSEEPVRSQSSGLWSLGEQAKDFVFRGPRVPSGPRKPVCTVDVDQ